MKVSEWFGIRATNDITTAGSDGGKVSMAVMTVIEISVLPVNLLY